MRVPPRARNSLFNPKYHSSLTSEALSGIENGNSMPRGQPKMVIRECSSRTIRQFTKLFPPTAAGKARHCDRQGLVPQHGEQGSATGKGSSHSMESKALRPAKARPTAWKARHCGRQRLVEEQEEQVAAAGKSSYRSMESKALRPAKARPTAWRARRCDRYGPSPAAGRAWHCGRKG